MYIFQLQLYIKHQFVTPRLSSTGWIPSLQDRTEDRSSPALNTKSLASGIYEILSIIHSHSGFSIQIFGFHTLALLNDQLNKSTQKIRICCGRGYTDVPLQLTNSIDQSSSWDAKRSLARQEILRILWKPKIHYSNYNSPLSAPILSNSIQFMSHSTSQRSILILSSHLRRGLSSGLLPSGLLINTLYAPLLSLFFITCFYIPCLTRICFSIFVFNEERSN